MANLDFAPTTYVVQVHSNFVNVIDADAGKTVAFPSLEQALQYIDETEADS